MVVNSIIFRFTRIPNISPLIYLDSMSNVLYVRLHELLLKIRTFPLYSWFIDNFFANIRVFDHLIERKEVDRQYVGSRITKTHAYTTYFACECRLKEYLLKNYIVTHARASTYIYLYSHIHSFVQLFQTHILKWSLFFL